MALAGSQAGVEGAEAVSLRKEEEALWQEMADLTLAKCRQSCHDLGSCCEGAYCEMAAEIMEKAGLKVPPMPFLKEASNGGVAKCPHCGQDVQCREGLFLPHLQHDHGLEACCPGGRMHVPKRCIIPPHFRPLCSLHQCKIAGMGFDPHDKEWTERYFELRAKLEEIGYGT